MACCLERHGRFPSPAVAPAAPRLGYWRGLLTITGKAINPLVEVSHVEQNPPAHPAEGDAQALLEQAVANGLGRVADVGGGFLDGQQSLGSRVHRDSFHKNATEPLSGLVAGLPAGYGLACLEAWLNCHDHKR